MRGGRVVHSYYQQPHSSWWADSYQGDWADSGNDWGNQSYWGDAAPSTPENTGEAPQPPLQPTSWTAEMVPGNTKNTNKNQDPPGGDPGDANTATGTGHDPVLVVDSRASHHLTRNPSSLWEPEDTNTGFRTANLRGLFTAKDTIFPVLVSVKFSVKFPVRACPWRRAERLHPLSTQRITEAQTITSRTTSRGRGAGRRDFSAVRERQETGARKGAPGGVLYNI